MTKFYKYNKHAGIYKWQNKINGKCYIGQSIDLGLRLRHHTYKYNHGRYNSPLYKAFEKYGIENFTLEVLYDAGIADISIKPLLNQLEIGYIEKYNAYGITGYNQTRGGDNVTISRSEEVKQHNRRTKDTFLYDMQTGWTIKCTSRINAADTIHCDVGFLICCANGMYTRIYNRWLVANSETALVEKINHYRFKK